MSKEVLEEVDKTITYACKAVREVKMFVEDKAQMLEAIASLVKARAGVNISSQKKSSKK